MPTPAITHSLRLPIFANFLINQKRSALLERVIAQPFYAIKINLKKIIIQGSSRKDGDIGKVVADLIRLSKWDLIDLNDYNFSYYDYEHLNKDDDFIGLMKKLLSDYDIFVLATPVYWYSMSGIMKVFFDRITDLLTIEKDLGRKLRGKHMAVISCSYGNNLGDQFWIPFKKSAEYLGMNYVTDLHIISTKISSHKISQFVQKIEKTA